MQNLVLPAGRKDAARAAAFLQALPTDRAWSVKVEEFKSKRSAAQNNYLHGVCYKTLGDAIGYEAEDVAEFLCGTYFGWTDKKVPKTPRNPEGIESVPVRTTTRDANGKRDVLGKQAFSDYVAFIQRFAASKGIYIPDPEETL
jgi:hypothetical protein